MKRAIQSRAISDNHPLPFPEYESWNEKQKQVRYLIGHLQGSNNIPIIIIDHISHNYGEFMDVVEFAKFFIDFWNISGQYLDLDFIDSVDENFINWVKIIKYDELCGIMSLDPNTYKKFMFESK